MPTSKRRGVDQLLADVSHHKDKVNLASLNKGAPFVLSQGGARTLFVPYQPTAAGAPPVAAVFGAVHHDGRVELGTEVTVKFHIEGKLLDVKEACPVWALAAEEATKRQGQSWPDAARYFVGSEALSTGQGVAILMARAIYFEHFTSVKGQGKPLKQFSNSYLAWLDASGLFWRKGLLRNVPLKAIKQHGNTQAQQGKRSRLGTSAAAAPFVKSKKATYSAKKENDKAAPTPPPPGGGGAASMIKSHPFAAQLGGPEPDEAPPNSQSDGPAVPEQSRHDGVEKSLLALSQDYLPPGDVWPPQPLPLQRDLLSQEPSSRQFPIGGCESVSQMTPASQVSLSELSQQFEYSIQGGGGC